MSHDLQFSIENGDGSRSEMPRRGELDHLPDSQSEHAQGGSLQYIQEKLKQSSHPTVVIFHLLFKAGALFLYIFGRWFVRDANDGADFIAFTVACILLLAADFWVVKNVTGRFLVGLRWWNKVEDETTTWIFESAEDKAINAFDRSVFWTVLYATPVVWGGLLLSGIFLFQFKWLLIVVIALALSLANVYGYYKCSTDQKARFQRMMQDGAQRGAMAMVQSSMLNMLTGNGGSSAPRSNSYV